MSTWQDLVTASLIGTERSAVPPAAVPGLPIPADAPADPAAILLDRAALLTVARRGGRLAEHVDPLPAAEPDPAAAVSPAAGRRLARMLSGEHPDLLAEWLTAAVARGRRAPAHLLPTLLDRARRVSPTDPELRRLAALAGGSRARWLAGLNHDWAFVTTHTVPGDDAWRLGDGGQRRGYLTLLRGRDPDAARELIAASWDAAEVRGWAAYLLARLPGSALGQRMAGRALGCLRLAEGISGTHLVASPPAECDAAMRRDGITPGQGAGRAQLASQAHLMLEVMARTPLDTWTGEFGRSAEQILAVPAGRWAPVLFTGWSRAAMAQRDQEWMAALINWAIAGGLPSHPSGAETLRQLVRRVEPTIGAPETTASRGAGPPPAVRDAITVLRFRYDMLKELDYDHSAG